MGAEAQKEGGDITNKLRQKSRAEQRGKGKKGLRCFGRDAGRRGKSKTDNFETA